MSVMFLSKNFRWRHSLIGLLLYIPLLQRVLSNTQWPPFQNHEGQSVNISKLISVAKSTLGVDSFCNASKERIYARLSHVCICDGKCAHFQNCCPDNPYAYLKQSCLNIALYQSERSYKVARKMVDACPYHENHPLPICRTGVSRSIFDVPVLSNKTLLAYVHRLCALCSLEKDKDLKPWEPVLANCVSSHSEITGDQLNTTVLKRLLSEGECVLVYNDFIPNFYNCIPSILRVPGIVDYCNVTGLWDKYDPDIDWACKHHTTQFEQFANVFCYICNPDLVSHTSRPLIDTCNITGYWKTNDITIEQGCLHYNSLSRFHPFKNAFCYMCNMFDDSFRGFASTHLLPPIETNSINVYVLETYDQETSEFLTEIQLVEIKIMASDYTHYPPNKAVEEFVYECNQRCLSNYENASDDYKVCTDCHCNTMKVCEKSNEGKEIFYCVPDTFKSNYRQHNFYLVVGVCLFPNVSNEIKQKCEEPDPDNIIDNLPVILTNDVIMFRNRYCSKCNGYDNIRFLEIQISCGVYIDARLTQSLEHLIQLSVQNSCKIKYVRNNCNDLNVMTPLYTQPISKCNTTGYWEVEGLAQDILYACEHDLSGVSKHLLMRSFPTLDKRFQEFKNIYCYVCNPYNSYPLYTKCNMSEKWETYDAQVENDCKNGPRESKWGPFKNFDCFKCNDKRDASNEVYILKDLIGILVHESYRYVFDVSPKILDELARIYADPTDFHQTSKKTLISFDDTYCARGKILMNGSCDYPTESPGAINRYGVYYRVILTDSRIETLSTVNQASLSSSQVYNVTSTYIWELNKAVLEILDNRWTSLNASIQIEVFESWTNISCMDSVLVYLSSMHEISMLIYSEILVTSLKLKKRTFETILLQNKTFQILFGQKSFDVNVEQDLSLFFLRNSSIFDQGCFQREEMPYSLGIENPVIISDLLVCTQKDLHCGFTINTQNTSVYIPKANITLHQFQFLYINESVVRVCSDTYNYILNFVANRKYDDALVRVYAFFSFSCTSVSMLCLVISLVTYCIHPELRSRPGKCMIHLIISLLCAQGTLQFGLKQTGNMHVCIAIGIAIHFSWLWFFSTLCVCTLNVYQTFTSDLATMHQLSQSKRLPILFVVFPIASPFLLVASTALYHLVSSDFQSFGYGNNACFISDIITILVSFIVPSLVICLANLIMYSISFHAIVRSVEFRGHREWRREFFIYVKLYTLTGISWSLQIVDAALDLTALSFIVTLVNALQGFFIFLSFICNQKVISLYKKILIR